MKTYLDELKTSIADNADNEKITSGIYALCSELDYSTNDLNNTAVLWNIGCVLGSGDGFKELKVALGEVLNSPEFNVNEPRPTNHKYQRLLFLMTEALLPKPRTDQEIGLPQSVAVTAMINDVLLAGRLSRAGDHRSNYLLRGVLCVVSPSPTDHFELKNELNVGIMNKTIPTLHVRYEILYLVVHSQPNLTKSQNEELYNTIIYNRSKYTPWLDFKRDMVIPNKAEAYIDSVVKVGSDSEKADFEVFSSLITNSVTCMHGDKSQVNMVNTLHRVIKAFGRIDLNLKTTTFRIKHTIALIKIINIHKRVIGLHADKISYELTRGISRVLTDHLNVM